MNQFKAGCTVEGRVPALAHVVEQDYGPVRVRYGCISPADPDDNFESLDLVGEDVVVALDDGRVMVVRFVQVSGEPGAFVGWYFVAVGPLARPDRPPGL
jgi:hypothetical protein